MKHPHSDTPSETLALIPPNSEPQPCPLLRQSDEKKRERQRARGRHTQRNARVFGSMASVLSSLLLWSLPAFLPSRYSFSRKSCAKPFFFNLPIYSLLRQELMAANQTASHDQGKQSDDAFFASATDNVMTAATHS